MRTQPVTITALIAVATLGGVAGAMIGQGNTTAPPAATTTDAGAAVQAPAVADVSPTPDTVASTTTTRTVTVVKRTQSKGNTVTEPQQPTGWTVPDEDTGEADVPDTRGAVIVTPAPNAPVQPVIVDEPDPTPNPDPASAPPPVPDAGNEHGPTTPNMLGTSPSAPPLTK